MRRKGFTLIELLVVIAIIGILVVIGAASWSAVASRGRDNARKTDLARLKGILKQVYADSRTYPKYDKGSGTTVLRAGYQLFDSSACAHVSAGVFLTPNYLTNIPPDPTDRVDYSSASCATLASNQKGAYLYISSPTGVTGPATPDGFGLLATLERPANDELLANPDNPLKQTTLQFGAWYPTLNAYSSLGVNANYLVTSTKN